MTGWALARTRLPNIGGNPSQPVSLGLSARVLLGERKAMAPFSRARETRRLAWNGEPRFAQMHIQSLDATARPRAKDDF